MDTEFYIQTQLALECIKVNEYGLLERAPCPNPDEMGLLYIYNNQNNYFLYFRSDLASDTRERLCEFSLEMIYHKPPSVEAILSRIYEQITINKYHTNIFPSKISVGQTNEVVTIRKGENLVFTISDGEKYASSCISARENEYAAECYVFTEPAYRQRGYAGKTVVAWAKDIQSKNKIPFYSYAHDNRASAKLAKRLSLIPCFSLIVYSDV